jgi:xanthine dehydrogenase accessory factor
VDDIWDRVHDLKARGESFVLATVTRVERPASARPGMKAIILADGTLEGWVGGSCAHPIIVREAQNALRQGSPRLISLSPERNAQSDREGVIHHPMTCHSGGTLEIYVEPMLPQPQLLLVGEAPLVPALARLGRLQGFAVWVADAAASPGAPASNNTGAPAQAPDVEADLRLPLKQLAQRITSTTYAVIATMGNYDEEALEQIVGARAGYVGLVASRKRAESVFTFFGGRGVDPAHLQRVKAPAGLDIGAVTPEEIALSIMAEIVQVRRSQTATGAAVSTQVESLAASPVAADAIDPVCGMTVEIATARHTFVYQGRTFYFCCAHCRQAFEREPAQYLKVGA